MKTLYFDHNLIIDIQNNRKPGLVERIKNIDSNQYQILFSPAHIEEIAAMKMHHGQSEEKVCALLDLLDKITKSKALLPYKRLNVVQKKLIGVYISNESPYDTYDRVIAGYSKNYIAEDHQKSKIAMGQFIQKITGNTSRETNSIDIQKEIDIFKIKLHEIVCENYLNLLPTHFEYLPVNAPACQEIDFKRMGAFFPLHEMIIEKIFEFLEVRRYFPDRPDQFISGLHDTTHAIYAAYCDIFVTNDKKLKNKTAATYRWFGVDTLILDANEFSQYLEK